MKKKKHTGLARVTSTDLGEQYQRVQEHPIGALLLDDLAATAQFGPKTARVGIAADGNPCVVGHDEATVNALAKSIQENTVVHTAIVPPLNRLDFKVMLHKAAKGLSNELPPGAVVKELPAAVPTVRGNFTDGDDNGETVCDDCGATITGGRLATDEECNAHVCRPAKKRRAR